MKKIFISILPILFALSQASAATLTVDNNAGSVVMFTGVQAAIDAADPGDTILIAGSPTFYGDFTS